MTEIRLHTTFSELVFKHIENNYNYLYYDSLAARIIHRKFIAIDDNLYRILNIHWNNSIRQMKYLIQKEESFRNNYTNSSICVIHNKLKEFVKEWIVE